MAESRKTVTIVFTDVTGSTALGEQTDPEVMRRIMERYFEDTRTVLEKHGGTVEKFIGDAVMAVFGIPTVHEDDALRAVRAAAEMRERLAALNEEFERERGIRIAVRTGVNTGEVVAGDASSGQAFATGDAVNVAARLEQAAEPGEILLGPVTHELVASTVRAEPLEPVELKGKAQAIEVWRLVEVLPHAPAFTRRIDAPFVGRETELERLRAAYEAAQSTGACQLVTVTGAPGIGKSRLVRELITAIGDEARVVVGRCLSYGEGITYWPLAEIVHQTAGADPRSGLVALLEEEPDGHLAADRILSAIGARDSPARTEEIFWAARVLFERLAHERPLIAVVDDIHWAEPTLLDLIEYLVGFARAPMLVTCTARLELYDERPHWPRESTVELEALGDEDASTLIDSLFAEADLPHSLHTQIQERAEGNPLFVEQMLALAREKGAEELALPATIQALLSARVDNLPPDERNVLVTGAVEGRLFHRGAVSALVPDQEQDSVPGRLLILTRKTLIRPDEALFPGDDAFRFVHALVREAAYDAASKELRADLHERFAAWVEGHADGRMSEVEEIVAYHLEQAALYGREVRPGDPRTEHLAHAASERLKVTGRRALERGDLRAAATLLERALDLLPPDDPERMSLVPNLFDCYLNSARLADAESLLAQAEAEVSGDERTMALLAVLRAWLGSVVDPEGWLERASREARAAITVFEAAEDHASLSRAWLLVHIDHWSRGQLEAARQAAERGLEAAERAGDLAAQVEHRKSMLGAAVFGHASVKDCLPLIEQELAWARATGARGMEASLLIALGEAHACQGRIAEGRRLIAEGDALLRDMGAFLSSAAHTPSWAHLLFDGPEEIERELRKAYETLAEAGEKGFLSTVAACLAEVALEQGDGAEAARLLDEAEEAGGRDDVTTQVIVLRVRARLLAEKGDQEVAVRLAREAVARAAATEYAILRADALSDLALVLARGGGSAEAMEVLREAIAAYERKGYLTAAERTRAHLAELQSCGSPSQ